jgi:hypothetical protein
MMKVAQQTITLSINRISLLIKGLLMMVVATSVQGQMLSPIDNGVKDTISAVCFGGDNLVYASHFKYSADNKSDTLQVSYFNGIFWTQLPIFGTKISDGNPLTSMSYYNGKVYVGGKPFRLTTGVISCLV